MRTLMQIAEDARRSKYAVAKLGTNDKNRGIPVSYTHLMGKCSFPQRVSGCACGICR